MKKIEKQCAEKAVSTIINLTKQIKELSSAMKEAEDVIEDYGRQNIADFSDNRLPCGIGIIQIKAGSAKPIDSNGKAVTKIVREHLANLLPSRFISVSIDAKALFESDDKIVRQILQANGISIVREDKFVVV
ncbi:MAG: hypothetical protein RR277_00345 [Rikenellaceae bacterium]